MDKILTLQQDLQEHLDTIRRICRIRNETIAVAESVTAGCIQSLISTADAAQEFFQGGITVYNCSQKAIHLGVEPVFADSCNGVDPVIARQMASAVCILFRSQIGVAITGYATRMPEEGINDLYAYMAIVRNGRLLHEEKLQTSHEGMSAQCDYAGITVLRLAALLSE